MTNIARLYDGELCYAIDEDRLYAVENGQLVPIGATSAANTDAFETAVLNAQAGESLNYNGNAWVNGGVQDGGSF